MAAGWVLRPMRPTDGPAMDALLRAEPSTGEFRLTTRYRRDVYDALLAQHADLVGVVVESDTHVGLLGMATMFFGDVRTDGQPFPSAFLENLKVHPDARRQGIGSALAAWRIDQATRRFGDDGMIMTAIESSNIASLATATRWATQLLGPLRIVVGRTTARGRGSPDVRVRAPTDAELDEVVAGAERYRADHVLHAAETAEGLARLMAPSAGGLELRRYRVAVAPDRRILAGALVTQRYVLMEEHVDHVPVLMRVLGRLMGLLPADGIIRSIEVSRAWHAPGHVDAARLLWDGIRRAWSGRCAQVVAVVDPRTTLAQAFTPPRGPGPRPQLMIPVRSSVPLDPDRPVEIWR